MNSVDAIEANPQQLAGTVRSRDDFVVFVRALAAFRARRPDEWENPDLPRYLDALARWVEDMDGYYAGRGQPVPKQPSWRVLADILIAAAMYE